jgi:hypothetical protein
MLHIGWGRIWITKCILQLEEQRDMHFANICNNHTTCLLTPSLDLSIFVTWYVDDLPNTVYVST